MTESELYELHIKNLMAEAALNRHAEVERLEAENAALREENRKLRDAWPDESGGYVYQSGPDNKWYALLGQVGPCDTRDEAINQVAGIKEPRTYHPGMDHHAQAEEPRT